jgi:membrane carboxypeptidase/penicillin-binding protein PbpC
MITKKRSVGSVLKPFLYLIALHSHDPNDLILDEKKVYETEQD